MGRPIVATGVCGSILHILVGIGCNSALDGPALVPDQGAEINSDAIDAGVVPRYTKPPTSSVVAPDPIGTPFMDGGVLETYADGALPNAKVLYAASHGKGVYGIKRIATGVVQTLAESVVGFEGQVSFDALKLTNQIDSLPVETQRPQVIDDGVISSIRLPNQLGRLYYYHRKSVGLSGLMISRPTGELDVLLEVPGLYSDTLTPYVALDVSGDVGAVVQNDGTVWIFSTDRPADQTNVVAQSVKFAAPIVRIFPQSMMVTPDSIVAVAQLQSGQMQLLQIAIADPAVVKLIGSPANYIHDELVMSSDGRFVVTMQGVSDTQTAIYRHMVTPTPSFERLTPQAATYGFRGDKFGLEEGQLAISPNGHHVAYVRQDGSLRRIYLAKSPASSPTVHITTTANFENPVRKVANLFFADDNHLYFMAGDAEHVLELYHYSLESNQLEKMVPGAKLQAPFVIDKGYAIDGGWLSHDRRWAHFWLRQVATGARDWWQVDLIGHLVQAVTTGGIIEVAPENIVTCSASGTVYFVAQKDTTNYVQQVWAHRPGSSRPATALTTMVPPSPTVTWDVQNIALSANCELLVFAAGTSRSSQRIWQLPLGHMTLGQVEPVTTAPRIVGTTPWLTRAGDAVVYTSGNSAQQQNLRLKAVRSGSGAILDPKATNIHLMSVE